MIQIKVEPALFYRACDEIGLLLIQDMPSMRPSVRDPANPGRNVPVGTDEAQAEFNRQLEVMVHQLKNYPSIFTWVSRLKLSVKQCVNLIYILFSLR